MREDREKLVLATRFVLQQRLRAFAFRDLAEHLLVGVLERAIQALQLARVVRLELVVRGRELRVRYRHCFVEPRELAALKVELHEHRHLAAQNLRDNGHRHVIDGAHLVAAQPVEIREVHARDEDDRRLRRTRMAADHRGGLEAVHPRHAHVEQDRRDLHLEQLHERLVARLGAHEVVSEAAEDRLVSEEARGRVVDEQDVGPFAAGRVHPGLPAQRRSHTRSSDKRCSLSTGFAM